MSVSEVSLQDGFVFARSIRALAQQARDVLQDSESELEVRALFEEIDRLEVEAKLRHSDDLVRWLESLRRIVEEQVMAPI